MQAGGFLLPLFGLLWIDFYFKFYFVNDNTQFIICYQMASKTIKKCEKKMQFSFALISFRSGLSNCNVSLILL